MSKLHELDMLIDIRDAIDTHHSVLVEFGAPWCGPCTKFLPHLTKFAETNDDVFVVKVNVDVDPAVQAEYSIQQVPQVMLFEDGKYVRHIEGRTVLQLHNELA